MLLGLFNLRSLSVLLLLHHFFLLQLIFLMVSFLVCGNDIRHIGPLSKLLLHVLVWAQVGHLWWGRISIQKLGSRPCLVSLMHDIYRISVWIESFLAMNVLNLFKVLVGVYGLENTVGIPHDSWASWVLRVSNIQGMDELIVGFSETSLWHKLLIWAHR